MKTTEILEQQHDQESSYREYFQNYSQQWPDFIVKFSIPFLTNELQVYLAGATQGLKQKRDAEAESDPVLYYNGGFGDGQNFLRDFSVLGYIPVIYLSNHPQIYPSGYRQSSYNGLPSFNRKHYKTSFSVNNNPRPQSYNLANDNKNKISSAVDLKSSPNENEQEKTDFMNKKTDPYGRKFISFEAKPLKKDSFFQEVIFWMFQIRIEYFENNSKLFSIDSSLKQVLTCE